MLSAGSIMCIGSCLMLGFCALLSAFALHHLDPAADAERHRRRRRNKTFAGVSMQGWRPVVAVIATFQALINAWLAFMIAAAVDSAMSDESHGASCTLAMQNITLRIACFSQAFAAVLVSAGHFISLLYWIFLQIFYLQPQSPSSICCRCPCLMSCGGFGNSLSFRRLVAVDSPPASPPVLAPAVQAAGGAAAERQHGDDVDAAGAFAAVAAALDAAAAEGAAAAAGDDHV